MALLGGWKKGKQEEMLRKIRGQEYGQGVSKVREAPKGE